MKLILNLLVVVQVFVGSKAVLADDQQQVYCEAFGKTWAKSMNDAGDSAETILRQRKTSEGGAFPLIEIKKCDFRNWTHVDDLSFEQIVHPRLRTPIDDPNDDTVLNSDEELANASALYRGFCSAFRDSCPTDQ